MTSYKKIIIILYFTIAAFNIYGQNSNVGSISGKVLDRATKQPVPGATVVIRESKKGTSTDTSGNFKFDQVTEGNYSLEVQFIGYENKLINDVLVIRNKITYREIEIHENVLVLKDVQVTTFKYENNPAAPVSTYTFSREEISLNPGAQADIFRAIGMLPGVTSSGGEYSAIAVRGQGVRENVYIVDDIPLTEVGHLEGNSSFNDPNGGRYSIFSPRVIDNAQFQGGGFGAAYGRRSASYLGLGIKEGSLLSTTIDGQIDLMGVTINYDGPSLLFKNTSLFVSARYQDFKLVLNMVGVKYAGFPKYGDFVFKSVTNLNSKNKFSTIVIISPEYFAREISNVEADENLNDLRLVSMNRNKIIAGLNLRTLTSKNSYLKNILYFTTSSTDLTGGSANPKIDSTGVLPVSNIPYDDSYQKQIYSETKIGYRTIFTLHFKKQSHLTSGIDVSLTDLSNSRTLERADTLYVFDKNDFRPNPNLYYSVIDPQYFNADFKGSSFEASAYVNYSFVIFDKLTVNAGLRYDYTGFAEQHMISPRISGSYYFTEKTSVNFAAGIYYQDPLYSDVADQPSGNILKDETVNQFIIGFKNYFTSDTKLTIEAWYKTFDNLVTRPVNGYTYMTNSGTGWGSGVDINLTKRLTKKIHGQIGYSWMQSKRDDNDGFGEYNFTFCQPHQLNMLISYKFKKRWIFSSKFRYATGKPTDNYIVHENIFTDNKNIRYSQEITERNAGRLPYFLCWDLRVDYKLATKKVNLTVFADVVDVLNRQIVNGIAFNSIQGTTYYDGLSIFPSFGIKFEF